MAMMNSRRGAPLKQTFAPVAAAPQRAAPPATPGKAPEGRVIASPDVVEPTRQVNSEAGAVTRTGGRAHGVVSGIGNAVSYALNDSQSGNTMSGNQAQAHGHLSLAFDHLAMHHGLNASGNYAGAATSLAAASNEIKNAISRGSLGMQKSITHLGTEYNVADLKSTLDAHVNTYTNKIAGNKPSELTPPTRHLGVKDSPTTSGSAQIKFSDAGSRFTATDSGSNSPGTIPHVTDKSAAMDRLSQRGIGAIERPRVSSPSRPAATEMSRSAREVKTYHLHNAYTNLANGRKIPIESLSSMSDSDIDKVHSMMDSHSVGEKQQQLVKSAKEMKRTLPSVTASKGMRS